MKRKIKGQKGSMAVFVSIVLLTMLFILSAIFLTSNSVRQALIGTVLGVKESYESDNSRASEVYSDLTATPDSDPTYVQDGLILYYDAINNTGNGHSSSTTTWKDLSGHGNDLTLYNFGNTSTSGWSDNALNFDGVNDYGNVTTLENYMKGDFTISLRFYTEQYNNYRGLFGNHMGGGDTQEGIVAQFDNSILYVGHHGKSVGLDHELVTNKEITLTILMSTSIGIKAYINGNFVQQVPISTQATLRDANFWVGKSLDRAERYFIGRMNNFMIYDRLLSDSEIEQNYKTDLMRY